MHDEQITTDLPGNGVVRKLTRHEMPMLREHLLRLDPESRIASLVRSRRSRSASNGT